GRGCCRRLGGEDQLAGSGGAHGLGGRAHMPALGGGQGVGARGIGERRQGRGAGARAEAHRGGRVGRGLAGRGRAGGQARPGYGLGAAVGRDRVVVEVVGGEGGRERGPGRGGRRRRVHDEVVEGRDRHRQAGRARLAALGDSQRVGARRVGNGRKRGLVHARTEGHRGRGVRGGLAGRRRARRQTGPGDGLGAAVGGQGGA